MQRPAKPLTPVRFRIQPPLNIMKIGIIGYGFVGKALEASFNSDVEIMKIDPKLNRNIELLRSFNADALFICVPTPMNEDFSQDVSILKNVLDEINDFNFNKLVVLKSTVLPSHIKEIKQSFSNLVYNPEFLREKYAYEDFINSKLIIFGGDEDNCKLLSQIYKNHTKCSCTDYIYTDAICASFVKYTINSFLATKVTFFNELNHLFNESGTEENWDNFINALSRDERLGNSHMQVPGHDGRFGFGGACLPKDSNAFQIYAKEMKKSLNVLKTAINTNNKIRASYNNETDRELEQKVKFTGDS